VLGRQVPIASSREEATYGEPSFLDVFADRISGPEVEPNSTTLVALFIQ